MKIALRTLSIILLLVAFAGRFMPFDVVLEPALAENEVVVDDLVDEPTDDEPTDEYTDILIDEETDDIFELSGEPADELTDELDDGRTDTQEGELAQNVTGIPVSNVDEEWSVCFYPADLYGKPYDSSASGVADTASGNNFYMVCIDVAGNLGCKYALNGFWLRFHGTVDKYDEALFSDFVIMKDGIEIESPDISLITFYTYDWGYETVSDFVYAFETPLTENGIYSVSAVFDGVTHVTGSQLIESEPPAESANPFEFSSVGFGGYGWRDDSLKSITEISLDFSNIQGNLDIRDVDELIIMRDGEPIEYAVRDSVFRYAFVWQSTASGEYASSTSFHLVLTEPLTEAGVYTVTAVYKGIGAEGYPQVIRAGE